MKRREFIMLLVGGAAAAWPFATCAQTYPALRTARVTEPGQLNICRCRDNGTVPEHVGELLAAREVTLANRHPQQL